VEQFQLQ
jgi:hypothetical protein